MFDDVFEIAHTRKADVLLLFLHGSIRHGDGRAHYGRNGMEHGDIRIIRAESNGNAYVVLYFRNARGVILFFAGNAGKQTAVMMIAIISFAITACLL